MSDDAAIPLRRSVFASLSASLEKGEETIFVDQSDEHALVEFAIEQPVN